MHALISGDGKLVAVLSLAAAGLVDLLVLAVLARLLRIAEFNEVVALVTRRLPRGRRAGRRP